MNFNETLVSNPNELEKDHSAKIHVCSFCDAAFVRLNDLELHSQLHDKNKDFICLLCKAVFTDLQKLKLHDLLHSLQEANEDVTNIDQLVLPFGYSACNVCGEKFSCDEELVNHSVNHKEVATKFDSAEIQNDVILDDQSVVIDSLNAYDKPVNYPILRQKIIKAKNGDIYIRFTLLDHEKDRCEEFTRIIRNETVKEKVDLNIKKNSLLSSKAKKKINSKTTKSPKKSAPKKSGNRKSVRNAKRYSSDSDVQIIDDVKGDDSDVQEIGTSRRSKVKALKKKIWKDRQNPNLFRRIPLITKSKVTANKQHKLFTCSICKKTFTLFSVYKKHRISHKFINEPQKIPLENICNVCKSPFSTRKQLQLHQKMHNVDNVHKCNKCKRIFYHIGHLTGHNCKFLPHAICKICKYAFTRKSHLRKHLLNVHNLSDRKAQSMLNEYVSDKKINPKIEPRPNKLKEFCKICNVTILKRNFIRHLSKIHNLKKDEIKLLRNDSVRNRGEEMHVKSVIKKTKLSVEKDTYVESKSSASDDDEKESSVIIEDGHLSESSETLSQETKDGLGGNYQPSSVEKNYDNNEENSVEKVDDKSLVKEEGNQDEKNLVRKDDNQDKKSLVKNMENDLSKNKNYNTKKNNIPLRNSNRQNVLRKIVNSNSVLDSRAAKKNLPSTLHRSMSLRSKESSPNTMKNKVKKVQSTVKKTISATRQVVAKKTKSEKVVNGIRSSTIKKATKVLNKKAVKTSVRAIAVQAKSKGSIKKTASAKSPLIKKKNKTSLENSNSVKKISHKNNLQSSLKNKSKTKNKPKK